MAQKLPLLKLLQEIRGYAEAGNRAAVTRFPLLEAAELRSSTRGSCLPHRRFHIPVREEHHAAPCEIPVQQASLADAAPLLVIK